MSRISTAASLHGWEYRFADEDFMPVTTIRLTTEELQQLVNLLDAAIRHTGIQGATVALPLIRKLQSAHQAAVQEQKPPT